MTNNPDALNRYLDDLASGNAVNDSGIEPETVATVRRLREIGASPRPDTSFVDQLEETLMNAVTTAPTALRSIARPLVPAKRAAPLPERLHPATFHDTGVKRWAPILISAALLLLTLAVAFGPLRPGGDGNGNHAAGPAVYAPASPSPDALHGETVLELTLPAEAIPSGEEIGSGLEHLTIPPGIGGTWEETCCPGTSVEYIISGSYTVTAEEAVQVVRADGAVEDVPAGTEVTLGAGDSLIARVETRLYGANTGTTPTELLSWSLIDATDDSTYNGRMLSGWSEGNFDLHRPRPLPAVEAVIELHRFTVEDGDVIPVTGDLTYRVAIGRGILVNRIDGTVTLTSRAEAPATVYVLTFTQPGARDGTPEARIQG